MSFVETSRQSAYPDEFSDIVAKMTASILQKQLAPIVETLRDIRDFQDNINFKLQTLLHTECRLPAADARTRADGPTYSTAASSSSVAAPSGLPDRPSTPAVTEHADSRPTTAPRQQLGDGFSVVPGHSRLLQRERPFSVAPDPMWNSSREIQPYDTLATTHAQPPPPYVLPPTYAEVFPPGGQIESVVQVVRHSEPSHVETIEIEPPTVQPSTLDVREVSVSSRNIPAVLVTEEDANNAPSYSLGPSWTFASSTLAQSLTAPDGAAQGDPSGPLDLSTFPRAEEAENSTTPGAGDERGNVGGGSGDEDDPNVESQLSEKARGKKRMREEDYPLDEQDEAETLECLLGEGCSSGGSGCNPGSSSSSSGREQPDRKRMKKMDEDTGNRVISTDRLKAAAARLSMSTRLGVIRKSNWSRAKKLNEMEKLHRRAPLLT